MGKFWLFAVCFFGLTQDVSSVVASRNMDIEILTEVDLHRGQNFQVFLPQVDIRDPISVSNFIGRIQDDCLLNRTWEEGQEILTNHLASATSQFLKAAQLTDRYPTSDERFDLFETCHRKLLNVLDIVALKIINKKQEAAVRAALAAQGS